MYVVVVVFVIHVSNGGGVSRYIVRRIGGVCRRGDYGRSSVVAAAAALRNSASGSDVSNSSGLTIKGTFAPS